MPVETASHILTVLLFVGLERHRIRFVRWVLANARLQLFIQKRRCAARQGQIVRTAGRIAFETRHDRNVGSRISRGEH